MTLLERWDSKGNAGYISNETIRRALAVAQAVEEELVWSGAVGDMDKEKIMRRADELLRGWK